MRHVLSFKVLVFGLLAFLCVQLALGQPQTKPDPNPPAKKIEINESRYKSVKSDIKRIKTSPDYRDFGAKKDNTWIAQGGKSLAAALDRLMNRMQPSEPPQMNPPSSGGAGGMAVFMQGMVYFVWFVLGALVLFLLVFAVRHFSWRSRLAKKTSALLDDDEPDRSLDEWLAEADRLAALGKHREACRALYLASLMRYDHAGIARFLRGETNWEHWFRIRQHPTGEMLFNFEPPTRAFDRVWYGFRVNGQADVDQFREWYVELTAAIKAVHA